MPGTEYVLTPDEARVLGSAARSGESTFYELAAATRLTPSKVRGVFGTLAQKNLAEVRDQGIRLTRDGQQAQRLLQARPQASSAYGRVHIIDKNDEQKGKWGGRLESNDRRVSATVTPDPANEDWYDVEMEVTSTDPANRPLTGKVEFFLHPSCEEDHHVVQVEDGKAILEFSAWGAFTVGVSADNGKTKLELDLAELPAAPMEFREL